MRKIRELKEGEIGEKEIQSFVDSNALLKDWLRKYSAETKHAYGYQFTRFFRWVHAKEGFKTPEELIDDHVRCQKDEKVSVRKRHAALVKEYAIDNPEFAEYSDSARALAIAAISSFYNYCEAPLTKAKGEFKLTGYAKYETKQFGVEDARKIIDMAPQREKTIFLVMLQGGFRIGDLLGYVNYRWREIKPQLEARRDPLKLTMWGGEYWTYITTDAIQELRKYILERGEPKEGEPIFVTSGGKPVMAVYVSKVLDKIGVKLGLIPKEELKNLKLGHHYPIRLHMFRKLFKSESSVAGRGIDPRYAEFFMGHASGLSAIGGIYDKSPELHEDIFEKEYVKIASYVNVFTGVTSMEKRLKEIEDFRASLTPEQLAKARNAGIQVRSTDAKKGRKGYKVRTGPEPNEDEKPQDCPDGDHCPEFAQIPEVQLLGHLKDGWQIIKELSNGEVIVKRVR